MRRATRNQYSAEEKIQVVIEGLRGRLRASEKLEIIRLVGRSHLPVKRTLPTPGISKPTAKDKTQDHRTKAFAACQGHCLTLTKDQLDLYVINQTLRYLYRQLVSIILMTDRALLELRRCQFLKLIPFPTPYLSKELLWFPA